MCEKILARIPSMTAEERLRLQENCDRIRARSKDALLVAEAKRILAKLSAVAQREAQFVARLSEQRRIEYAFRRLPASERERDAIRALSKEEFALPPEAGADESFADWRDEIDTMCRERRHLLNPGADAAVHRAAHELDWSACLIDIECGNGVIRLKPEATAAFARLGYVPPERATGGRAG